jgi:hypothetical protein
MGWADHIARMGETRSAYTVYVGRPEIRGTLGRIWRMSIIIIIIIIIITLDGHC